MHDSALQYLPIAVIGGGPVGLSAAAHLIARGGRFVPDAAVFVAGVIATGAEQGNSMSKARAATIAAFAIVGWAVCAAAIGIGSAS